MIVDGLIKRKVFKFENGEPVEIEIDFFFGVILLKLIKKELGLEVTELMEAIGKIESDLSEGLDTVVKFLFLAHKGWKTLQGKEPEITENDLWYSATAMTLPEFFKLFSDGIEQFGKSAGENPKMPSQPVKG